MAVRPLRYVTGGIGKCKELAIFASNGHEGGAAAAPEGKPAWPSRQAGSAGAGAALHYYTTQTTFLHVQAAVVNVHYLSMGTAKYGCPPHGCEMCPPLSSGTTTSTTLCLYSFPLAFIEMHPPDSNDSLAQQ